MEWSWNEKDSECWTHGTFDTKEEAIKDAYGCKEMIKRDGFYSDDEDPMIYIGQCEYIPLRTDLDADRELEYLAELYCDESGCDYYIYEGVSDEDKKWLEQKLSSVMEEFHERVGMKPNWFRIVNVESFVLH